MQLNELLTATQPLAIEGPTDIAISSLAYDSRQIAPGALFFALPGTLQDGFDFISQALRAGAVAVITERLPEQCDPRVCFVCVANVRRAMAQLADVYFGQPTRGIPVIGVTGTNGKTTVTYLLEAILRQAGFAPAVFGTIAYRFADHYRAARHTTPEAIDLLCQMADFRRLGADALIMEVSSHALAQYRVDGISFDLGVFTNLTPEHLDYHADLDDYFASKRRLFVDLLPGGRAVINGDDPYGRQLLELDNSWLAFGLNPNAQIHPAADLQVGRQGIHGRFLVAGREVAIASGLIGDFNVSNLLAAVAATNCLGIDVETISRGVAAAPQVPGRLEKIPNERGVLALVDYAHTGDALEQALKTLAGLEKRRLLTVVGCGGDRDRSKRPVMAASAVRYSDLAIFTSDNPRSEDPLQILEELRGGALAAGSRELSLAIAESEASGFVVVPDRRRAIELAGRLATQGDLVLVAGKGHEDYQVLGDQRIHFDDREELARVLSSSPAPEGQGHV